MADHLRGDLDEAERAAERCLDFAPAVAPSRIEASYGVQVLALRLLQGRAQELAPVVDEIIAAQPDLLAWQAVALHLASLRDDHTSVRAGLDRITAAGGLPHDSTWSGATSLCARAAARSGTAGQRRRLATELERCTGRMTWVGSCTLGPADLALAELALADSDRPRAAHHLMVARQVVDRLPAPAFASELDALDRELGLAEGQAPTG